jgi:hypothetical protein
LQRIIHERFDADLAWLQSLGAPVLERGTANPDRIGLRFDPRRLTETLVRRAGELRLGEPLRSVPKQIPVILATGGFQGNMELVRRFITPQAAQLRLRANAWSTGDGLSVGLEAGAALTAGMDEFYGRNMPAPPARVSEKDFVHAQQLYAHHAIVENALGQRYTPRSWSEVDVVQWTARQPRARAWYLVEDGALGQRVRDRAVADRSTPRVRQAVR